MKILGIETSCDDTGIAVLYVNGKNFDVLSSVVASQIKVHKKYGGVFPALAKREHQKNLVPTLIKALKEAKMLNQNKVAFFAPAKNATLSKILSREPNLAKKIIPFLKKYQKPNIDAIAVTNGPGLEPCLWVGVNFAKALSYFWNLPVIEVNHIEAHILINFLSAPMLRSTGAKYPMLGLVVSGGHTQLILIKSFGQYEIIGETRDDAAGECFDKCAKILGLGYPGGPVIAELAQQWKSEIRNPKFEINLPRPMANSKDYDFSFSGLKTAVLYAWQKEKQNGEFFGSSRKTHQARASFAAEVQQAIIDVLIKKTIKSAKDFKVKAIVLGGGVTANKELRKQFKEAVKNLTPHRVEVLVPPANLSTDNGLMIAVAGYFKAKQNKFTKWQDLEANANLRVK